MTIAINLSNLHGGGGVQVAVSFLSELSFLKKHASRLSVFASTEINREILSLGIDTNVFARYKVIDVNGIGVANLALMRELKIFKKVFTLFGPLYNFAQPYTSIVGFAQPWIIYPDNECYSSLPFHSKLKTRLKYFLQGYFFKKADLIVVELEHVKEALINQLNVNPEKISIIHNSLSSIYLNRELWKKVVLPRSDVDLKLGFVGRNYPHKNTSIFPMISDALEKIYGIKVKFYVTFNDDEWDACSEEFKRVCINVGALKVSECPSFYEQVDGVIFPSLLECFSATPLEAMAMKRPLFVSDRPFNRDVCQNHANYFDPLSAASAANTISEYFCDPHNDMRLDKTRGYAINFSNPVTRARDYLALL